MKTQKLFAPARRTWIVFSILFVLILIASLFVPWNVYSLSSHPDPVRDYNQAVERINGLKADRLADMNPECLTQFMTHGQKVQRTILFVHGYTNCPNEFIRLGKEFYDLGYNVLLVPLPHHGLVNRLNDEQGQLSADELAAYADRIVDIAQGLGDRVTIAGLSGGGIVSAWAAQNRKDVDTAVIVSPAFGYLEIPTALTAPAMNAVIALPDVFVWWDPELQAALGPDYTYPRYSKHALAQIMRLGFSVQVNSWFKAPLAKRIFVVTNANDESVNNALTARVVQSWSRHGAQPVTYEFAQALGLPHDLIDANQPGQNTELVDQKLIELMSR